MSTKSDRPGWSKVRGLIWDRPIPELLVVLWAILEIVPKFTKVLGAPLFPDVLTYRAIAENLAYPWATDPREPVWIWLVKFTTLFGGTEFQLRLLGISFFFIAALFFYFFLYGISKNRLLALLGFTAFLQNGPLQDIGLQALRDIGVVTFETGFLFFLVGTAPFKLGPRTRGVGLVLTAMGLIGTRMTMFAPVVAILAIALWKRKISLSLSALVLISSLAFLSPFLVHCKKKFNDAFYATNIHAVWWRNYEFVFLKKTGCEGCRSKEDLLKNMYHGPPVTSFQYVFGMRPLSEVLQNTYSGFKTLLFQRSEHFLQTSGLGNRVYFMAYLLGFLGLFFTPWWWLGLIPFLTINILAFSLPIGMPIRLFSPAAPFLSGCVAFGLWLLFDRLSQLLGALRRNFQAVRKRRRIHPSTLQPQLSEE